CQQWSGYPFTF
nr:immunoglobulin light chain junction region [Mus musculus]